MKDRDVDVTVATDIRHASDTCARLLAEKILLNTNRRHEKHSRVSRPRSGKSVHAGVGPTLAVHATPATGGRADKCREDAAEVALVCEAACS